MLTPITSAEAVLTATVIVGAGLIYAFSKRELPDVLYSSGMLMLAGGWLLNKATDGKWPLVLMFAGGALAFAVILTRIKQATFDGSA